jgi:protein PhnA
MTLIEELQQRSGSACELCGATEGLSAYAVPPNPSDDAAHQVWACQNCRTQLEGPEPGDPNHWRCLNDSMWSQVPAVQVVAWRMLHHLRGEGWPVDLIEMLYLPEDTLAWAKALDETAFTEPLGHLDSHGVPLQAGDTVVLTKDLNVKGAHFAAKRGTAVRGISLVTDDPEQIEGRVNGQQIVLLTKYVKKA